MKGYRQLEAENKKLRELLDRALDGATLAKWDFAWMQEAELLLRPPLQDDKPNFTGLRRMDGEVCGKCGHSSTFHTGIWLDGDKPHKCCTKVDCDCLSFVPTGKANEQAR